MGGWLADVAQKIARICESLLTDDRRALERHETRNGPFRHPGPGSRLAGFGSTRRDFAKTAGPVKKYAEALLFKSGFLRHAVIILCAGGQNPALGK